MISFILPYIFDREEQLLVNLRSLDNQTSNDWEIILVCHNELNPASAINWGVENARGEIICLTSPEVVNASTNVEEMLLLPPRTYWVGWCIETFTSDLPENSKDWTKENFKQLAPVKATVSAHCTEVDWAPWKYFLAVLHKDDWLPMGECFTDGIGWEDFNWSKDMLRSRIKVEFNPEIVGIHLWHSREYQVQNSHLLKRNLIHYWWRQSKYEWCRWYLGEKKRAVSRCLSKIAKIRLGPS